MTIDELEAECRAAKLLGMTHRSIVIPKGVDSRIAGFPRGERLCVTGDGDQVRRYEIRKLLAFVRRQRKLGLLPDALRTYEVAVARTAGHAPRGTDGGA
jgi:hypothetical protein